MAWVDESSVEQCSASDVEVSGCIPACSYWDLFGRMELKLTRREEKIEEKK